MEVNEQLHEKDTEEENPDDVLKALLCDKKLYSELYPHQRDGILFLYNAYKNEKNREEGSRNGVILADEMGLGKSIQLIVFLHFMIMNTHKLKNALLVMPAGLLSDWKGKLENWTPDMNVFIYQNSEKELPKKLRQLQKTGGILLVSYKMFIYHYKALTTYKGKPFNWDCSVFDEAHKLKNSASKTHKVAASISAGFHILMTGTPIQNNLKEYWSLLSLISDTCLLGTYKTFKTNFENPITKGMEADAGPDERALGMKLQEELEKKTEPFFLRRRKDQIQDPSDHTPSEGVLCLPKKKEYVVWIKLSPEQEAAYCNIVDESSVLTFQSIHYLIAVCTHPRLNSNIMEDEASEVHLAESGKLAFMLALLERLTANGNSVLVFSNYIKILDIIQKALTQTPWGRNAFLRIDGQNPNQRDNIVRRFQEKRSKNILLLTTSVGAEGLTLTAADSVVFANISWNQSVDAQAVGRAHRIGQTKEVTTYRLITCGTLEETMYRRQLFKGSLTRQAMGDEQNPLRHFTQDELKTYLTLQQTQFSYTQQQLQKQGAKNLNITEIFGEGISSLAAASLCGISDHGQLLTTSQGEDLEVDMARMHITETAKMCKQKIEAESHLTRQQAGEDLSVRKCFRKGKIRRKTQNARTPGLPRKYKCFKAPFSGPRRRTLHFSRPWVFESSDDSSNVSADDDENVSETSLPHISFSVKTEATSDLVDNHITFTHNSTCSKGKDDTLNVSESISKVHQSADLDTDMLSVIDLDKDSHIIDLDEDSSSIIDLEKDVSSVAAPVNSPVYSEHISIPDNSEYSELNCLDNTSDSDTSDSHSYKSLASSTMGHPTSPEDNNIEISGTNDLLEAKNTSVCTATVSSICKPKSNLSLVKSSDLSDLKEEANSKGVKFTDRREVQTQINSKYEECVPVMPLNLNPLFSESSLQSTTPENSLELQKKASQRQKSQELQLSDSNCEDFKTDLKPNQVATVLCDYSLTPSCISVCVTPSAGNGEHNNELKQLGECDELSVLQKEESPQDVTFTELKEQKDNMNNTISLDLSTRSSEYCQHLSQLASELTQSSSERELNILVADDEVADISYKDRFKGVLKSNQTAPILCDYSLTPGGVSLVETPSVEKGKNANCYKSSASSTMDEHSFSTSPEDNNIEIIAPDTSYKDSFKGVLKSSQTAPMLCDYSLTPGYVSLVDTPSVENGKHALSGKFQSTPLQSGQVQVHQGSKNCLKTNLPLTPLHQKGKAHNSTPEKSSPESIQLNRIKKRTPGLPHNYHCFPLSMVNTKGTRKTNSIFQENDSDKYFSPNFHEPTFSSTPAWKNRKANHDRLIPAMCGHSLNPSAFWQNEQTGNMTEILYGERQLLIREDTDVESIEQGTKNRATDTDQPEMMNRVNATVSELFSSTDAFVIKALRNLVIPKTQHRKTSRGSVCKSKRLSFSVTYQRHKKKLLKSMKNVDKNQITVEQQEKQLHSEDVVVSDGNVSLIRSENIPALVSNKSASLSPSDSCPKFRKETSPTQDIGKNFQFQGVKPLNDIPEGESVQPSQTVNVEYQESHHILTVDLSTSYTQLNQVTESSYTGICPKLQECSNANNSKNTSHEDDKDIGLQSTSQNVFFSLSPTPTLPDCEMSNGHAQVLNSFNSGHELMWEMSLSPGTQSSPRNKRETINYKYSAHAKPPKTHNQATSFPPKTKVEECSGHESGQEIRSYMDCSSISESQDDSFDCVEQAFIPVSNTQSPYNLMTTPKERDETPGSSNASQNSTSGVSEIHPEDIQDNGAEVSKPPSADGNESNFKNMHNDTKDKKMSDIQNDVEDGIDEMFRLLHNLKTL